ncbi:P-loop containing nucleoside triphosphate hydrolase protein [Rhizodiscina lignyota]|uniref:P-loop containing nucleoside triphosphate hydrolase protein n=1 Tax=Rhizodiscina lignyota TaxID=1504668 RepID=A0A9P4IGI7_9PEZI|nr:P-loop containing nucleoside triphosphate hydrolase protein [Rhizodiscina lignyota]
MAEKEETAESSAKESDVSQKAANAGFASYRRIFSYADKLSWSLNGIALFCAIGSGAMLPLMDLVFGKFVNSFNNFAIGSLDPAGFRSQVNKFTLWFVYLFVAKFVGVYIWTLALSISGLRTTKALRTHFLERILRQDIEFFDSPDNGSVAIQISTNGNVVNQGIGEKLGLFIQGIATFVSAFVVAFAVQWKLTLITLSIVPTIVIVTTVCIAFDAKIEGRIQPLYAQAGQLAEEAFGSIANVHAFWSHPKMAAMYDTYLSAVRKDALNKSPIYGAIFSTEFFCVYAGYALAFWQGIHMYARGEIDQPGQIVTPLFAVIVAATALTQVSPQIMQIAKSAGAAHGLFAIIDRTPAIDALDKSGRRPEEVKAGLGFRNVGFAYPSRPDVAIFDDFNLSIPPNKTTALVGPSGSGKSTVVALLERWYSPTAGEILMDGVPIHELNLQWLRSNIRIVQQEPVVFNGTVEENVKLGLRGTASALLPEKEQFRLVEDACKAAFADEFIQQLPEGYQTEIGQRGSRLSGGQKQRIAIARSIVSNPRVLLLDEATSALDPKAERIVQHALDNVSHNRTTLVIAHKLSTVRKADNIAVVAKGKIIEQGTHEQLIDLRSTYARLVKVQDLGEGAGPFTASEQDDIEQNHLIRTTTSHSAVQSPGNQDFLQPKMTMNYNLLHCLWILFREQPELNLGFIITLVACFTAGLTFPALAFIFSRMMNVFQLDRDAMTKRGDFFSLMFFVLALNNLISYFTLGWIANIISQDLTYKYRLEMFRNSIKQDRVFFDRPENSAGALVSNISMKPQSLQELLGINVTLILIGTINVVSSCIFAIAVGWKLGLVVVFGALPPIIFCGSLRFRLEFKLDDDIDLRFADSTALASEAVAAIRTVASLTLEPYILDRYRTQLQSIDQESFKSLVWTMFWYALTQSVSFLGMALGFWYGGRLMSTGEYSTTQFFIVFIAVIFSGEAAAQFFSFATSITKGQTAANYMLRLRSLKPTMTEHDNGDDKDDGDEKKADVRDAHVVCDDVQFSYPLRPGLPVIRNIGVDIPSSKTFALVGPSGCGKSTMVSLLERFYDPTSGCITYNGKDVSQLCPRRYRRNLALVEQEPTLYRMSIRDNVALGLEEDASEEQIHDACRAANIYDFVASLPDGFNTLCGTNGTQLSGGQKQRVAIARALIRNPKLLLLDEATSALDSESERIVQGALNEASAGRTTVMVAHRLSTVKDADCILVLFMGSIVEAGTHRELLDRRGMYYNICLGQSLERVV